MHAARAGCALGGCMNLHSSGKRRDEMHKAQERRAFNLYIQIYSERSDHQAQVILGAM